jgi:hypothetical protein
MLLWYCPKDQRGEGLIRWRAPRAWTVRDERETEKTLQEPNPRKADLKGPKRDQGALILPKQLIAIHVWVGFANEAPQIPIQINLILYRVLKTCRA